MPVHELGYLVRGFKRLVLQRLRGYPTTKEMSFHIGQKVVCIDGKFPDTIKRLLTQLPIEGQTYVVRKVHLGLSVWKPNQPRQSKVKLLLIGIVNHKAKDGKEHGFNAERFRSLEELKGTNANKELTGNAIIGEGLDNDLIWGGIGDCVIKPIDKTPTMVLQTKAWL